MTLALDGAVDLVDDFDTNVGCGVAYFDVAVVVVVVVLKFETVAFVVFVVFDQNVSFPTSSDSQWERSFHSY